MREDKDVGKIEITPQMIEAGIQRLSDLLEAGTGSAYVVSEVFQAMIAKKPARAHALQGQQEPR